MKMYMLKEDWREAAAVLPVYTAPCHSVCVFTLQQGGYEGRGHAAGAEQNSVAHLKLPLWNPTKNHGCYGRQETHNSGLNLGQRGREIIQTLLLVTQNEL